MKKMFVCVFSMVLLVACGSGNKSSLSLNKTTFAPGDVAVVEFTAPKTFNDNAWVGVLPSSVPHGNEVVNDQHDISYQYLKGQTKGTISFTVPTKSGTYDIRMNDTDNKGKEVASVTFTVTDTTTNRAANEITDNAGSVAPTTDTNVTLNLNKTMFTPQEQIAVTFAAGPVLKQNAWIGIVPSTIPHGSESLNDQHDLQYQYIDSKTNGTLTLTAPTTPGDYDIRLHDTDNNGNEIKSVSFTVK